jgi:anti-anti-sigma factor
MIQSLSLPPQTLLDPTTVARVVVDAPSLDPAASTALLTATRDAIEKGARAVVIDLSLVTFIDSLGVTGLVAAARRAPPGVLVVLCSLGAYAQTVARVTHLHELFPIYASADAAMAALAG